MEKETKTKDKKIIVQMTLEQLKDVEHLVHMEAIDWLLMSSDSRKQERKDKADIELKVYEDYAALQKSLKELINKNKEVEA